jgi:hypothetical protein
VSALATRLTINGADVSASTQMTVSATGLTAVYVPDASHQYPSASTVTVRIETADLATPTASATYTSSFATAGGLSTTGHAPARYSTGNPATPLIRIHVVDASGFGINPGALELLVNHESTPALIAEGDPINNPGSLEEFVLSYVPTTPLAAGPVAVEIRAADVAGHVMPPDVYWFFVGSPATGDVAAPTLTAA